MSQRQNKCGFKYRERERRRNHITDDVYTRWKRHGVRKPFRWSGTRKQRKHLGL